MISSKKLKERKSLAMVVVCGGDDGAWVVVFKVVKGGLGGDT